MKKNIFMKPIYLFWIQLVTVPAFAGGCEKKEINENELKCPVTIQEGSDDDVMGKWKLVKTDITRLAEEIRTEDYSCDDIIYHFREDSSLLISGVEDGIPVRQNGEYPFELIDSVLYEHMNYDHTLKIGSQKIACGIEDNAMILDASPLDGDTLYFVRVE